MSQTLQHPATGLPIAFLADDGTVEVLAPVRFAASGGLVGLSLADVGDADGRLSLAFTLPDDTDQSTVLTLEASSAADDDRALANLLPLWIVGNHYGSGVMTSLYTVSVSAYNRGAGTVGTLTGINLVAANESTGDVTANFGIQIWHGNDGLGTVTESRGLDIADEDGGGPVTTSVALNIRNCTQGTTNYAIKTGTGLVQFGDTLKLASKTVSQLPAASTVPGALCRVTDSNTATWGATIASGGANSVLAFSNGTNWTVAAK
jgi:hypothetical protein